jgi:phosphoribosylamine--glycine ligase
LTLAAAATQSPAMNVLVVGSGGREHALAWKIAASPLLGRLVCAPGNPGMAEVGEVRPIAAVDVEGQVALAREITADLVVIGPETAVAAGLADRLQRAGIPCFGPTAAAGRLETSKAFAKDFAARHGLPAGRHAVFGEAETAKAALSRFEPPYVIKADGLAAGKGVTIAPDISSAKAAIDETFGGRFGEAGARVLIEEFLEGEIASLFALCDGQTSLLFGGAQDHKRAFDGDVGPNTGGMGTYSPAPVLTNAVVEAARRKLIEPAFAAIATEGEPYRGALFCEMMVTADGPKLVEFNVRFGDPECQALMLRLDSDILPYLAAAATGSLAEQPAPRWRGEAAVCVVLAAEGYPGTPRTGDVIEGAEGDFGPDVALFHAGTARRADGALVSAGGRVLNLCARGPTLATARDRAYQALDAIRLPGGFCRRDIGWRALAR